MSAGGSGPTRKHRVLVVDDSYDVRDALTTTLESAGYDVTAASGAREAIDRLNGLRPSVVVTDLHMPEMDGFRLREELRRRCGSDIPVIALTGHGALRQHAVRTGFSAALQKPFDV